MSETFQIPPEESSPYTITLFSKLAFGSSGGEQTRFRRC
ncbi:hypothetical protein SLEP1_g14999 [Rubroshorea leprosula]|uniref:Uncharacterized protein n=1 Tax=Rubroshorea leprosula TaxID=152421 RepID=A0AAV5IUZ5_9ROSI|nr:hypothetical protein SLEP1_g14999 [Rubroshorea leprosula]